MRVALSTRPGRPAYTVAFAVALAVALHGSPADGQAPAHATPHVRAAETTAAANATGGYLTPAQADALIVRIGERLVPVKGASCAVEPGRSVATVGWFNREPRAEKSPYDTADEYWKAVSDQLIGAIGDSLAVWKVHELHVRLTPDSWQALPFPVDSRDLDFTDSADYSFPTPPLFGPTDRKYDPTSGQLQFQVGRVDASSIRSDTGFWLDGWLPWSGNLAVGVVDGRRVSSPLAEVVGHYLESGGTDIGLQSRRFLFLDATVEVPQAVARAKNILKSDIVFEMDLTVSPPVPQGKYSPFTNLPFSGATTGYYPCDLPLIGLRLDRVRILVTGEPFMDLPTHR